MKRLNIALMAGGDSSEREIALQSAAQIASALDPAKYDITLIDLHGRDWHYTSPDGRQWQVDKNDFSITIDGDRKTFDYALILIHGTPVPAYIRQSPDQLSAISVYRLPE